MPADRGWRVGWGGKGGALVADLGLLTLVASGLAAQAVPPRSMWWPQVAALALGPGAVAAGIAGVWMASRAVSRQARRGRWAAAALVHLGLASAVALRSSGLPWTEAGSGPGLVVASLNVGGTDRGDVPRIGRFLDETRPHLVALQEAPLVIEPDRSTDDEWVIATRDGPKAFLAREVYRVVPPPIRFHAVVNGPVFGRVPLTSYREGRLAEDDTAGRYSRTGLVWRGRPVAVYNVHLRSFERPSVRRRDQGTWGRVVRSLRRDFVQRAEEAAALRRLLGAEELPYLVLGDFNSTPDQWAYAQVADEHRDALRSPTFRHRYTFPDAVPLARIDGILTSPHWAIRSARVGPSGLSDHRAVLAEVVLLPDAPETR